MIDPDKVKLLFGPYKAPRVRRGDRAFCQVRDYAVLVIGWSAAPIPWPKCIRLEKPRAGRGLLIDDELARAIRHESVLAVAHWWGVSLSTVAHWRKAMGVTRTSSEGTHRLVLGAIQASLDVRPSGPAAVWTPKELSLVGALPDVEVARRVGRTPDAVSKKRRALGRPPVRAGRQTTATSAGGKSKVRRTKKA